MDKKDKKEKKSKKFIVSAVVGNKGQIVIPKIARDMFDINPGDTLIILGDEERGMAIMKSDDSYNNLMYRNSNNGGEENEQ